MITNFLLTSALAFEVQTLATGEEMYWGRMPVTYAWAGGETPAIPDVPAAIDASFTAWADVDEAWISVDERATDLAPTVDLDEENLVFFTSDWPEGNEALAITTTWTDDSGAIVQYDIYINATVPWSTTGADDAFDLRAAVTHEVGHVLGLGHSEVAGATMFAKHEHADLHRRELHDDDVEAARYLYGDPPPEPVDTGTEPSRAASVCQTGSGAPTGVAFTGLLVLTLLRRRGGAR